jgi:hypothetical protein
LKKEDGELNKDKGRLKEEGRGSQWAVHEGRK